HSAASLRNVSERSGMTHKPLGSGYGSVRYSTKPAAAGPGSAHPGGGFPPAAPRPDGQKVGTLRNDRSGSAPPRCDVDEEWDPPRVRTEPAQGRDFPATPCSDDPKAGNRTPA